MFNNTGLFYFHSDVYDNELMTRHQVKEGQWIEGATKTWTHGFVVSVTGRDSLEREPWVWIPVAAFFSQTFFQYIINSL